VDPLDSSYPVRSRRDVLQVLNSLARLYEAEPEAWENRSISGYLDAMVRWAEASENYYAHAGLDAPGESWQFFADVLRAGRVYE